MNTLTRISLAVALTFSAASTWAADLKIAAAADLKFALEEIKDNYVKAHPNDKVDIIFGSSGKLNTQIQQGAPFDLYFSADIQYPKALAEGGHAASEVKPYAVGRIVLWSNSMDASKMTLDSLKDEKIQHIAIADPSHAPYGKRAEEALTASKLWETLKPKLVYGENIAQTAQFVESANAQVGVIALSLALNPELSKQGGYYLIPDSLHQPLEQAFVITAYGKDNAAAKRFADYMQAQDTRAIMVKYGFVLPGEGAGTP